MSGRPRITGGRLRGRPLPQPVPDSARPTSSRVREALFSVVGHDLTGCRVLDAFGGSGLLGLEAWSRGAEVVIVERDRRAFAAIGRSIAELQAPIELICGDVLSRAAGLEPFDLVFVDPPYNQPVQPILEALAPAVRGRLTLEADARTEVPVAVAGLALDRSRKYGGTAIHLYRPEEVAPER